MHLPSQLLLLVHLHMLFAMVWSYSSGAPSQVCRNMKPQHGIVVPQSQRYMPYEVAASHSSYEPGVPVSVVIVGVDGETFKGFLVQARRVHGSEKPIGTWLDQSNVSSTMKCVAEADTVTHANSLDKEGIYLTWMPPVSPVGDVEFSVTIVHSKQTYWLFYPSVSLTASDKYPTETPLVTLIRPRAPSLLLPWQWALVSVAMAAVVMILTFIISLCCGVRCSTDRERDGEVTYKDGVELQVVRFPGSKQAFSYTTYDDDDEDMH